jgi:hypothetical protein
MKWFLVIYLFNCASIAESNLEKCPTVMQKIIMPSKEVCDQVKALNGDLSECWAKESK